MTVMRELLKRWPQPPKGQDLKAVKVQMDKAKVQEAFEQMFGGDLDDEGKMKAE